MFFVTRLTLLNLYIHYHQFFHALGASPSPCLRRVHRKDSCVRVKSHLRLRSVNDISSHIEVAAI